MLSRATVAGVQGDVHGDVGFVLSRRTTAFECRKNPKDFHCVGMTQFDGDEANSTDLVLQMEVEVDGAWGPYLFCNPANATQPMGPWAAPRLTAGDRATTPSSTHQLRLLQQRARAST